MAVNVFPAPANQWTLISSTTASSTAVNFTTISGYKQLKLVGANLVFAAANVLLRVNNSSSAVYAQASLGANGASVGGQGAAGQTEIYLTRTSSATACTFEVLFPTANQAIIQSSSGWSASSSTINFVTHNALFMTASAITELNIVLSGGTGFTGGTLYLYGAN